MKNLNKVLAMLVVFMMVVSTVAFASFTDVADSSSYSTAVKVDTDLGLIKGYEDGTFKPEGEITRAEFAAIVVRMLGQEAQANGAKTTTQFADVNAMADDWAKGYINIATQAGVINGYGDGNFGPNDQVKYEEAITMVVRALGYEPAIGSAGYPTGYLTKAGELGLTDNVTGVNGQAINRGAVAQIAFNALDVAMMTQSGYGTFTQYVINDGYSSTNGTTNVKKTILSENHKVVKVMGTVTDSSEVSKTSSTGDETVTINVTNALYNKFSIYGTKVAKVGTSDAAKFVGKKVIAFIYYDEFNNECTVKSIYETNISDKLTIDLADYNGYDAGDVTYFNDADSKKTITVSVNSPVYYNGVYVGSAKNCLAGTKVNGTDIKELSGSIEFALLDSSSTTDYDTIYINASSVFVVDEVKASTSKVKSKNGAATIVFDEEDDTVKSTLVDANGVAMDWTELNEFDVLLVKTAKTGSKTIVEARVIDNKVTGTVDETSGDEDDYVVVIGDKEYEITNDAFGDVEVGDEGTFYLDDKDKIVYVDTTSTVSDNYAFVIGTDRGTGFSSDTFQLQLLTKDNSIYIYNIAKTVKVTAYFDGEEPTFDTTKAYGSKSIKAVDAEQFINDLEGKLITFKANSSDSITAIETALQGKDTTDKKFALEYEAKDRDTTNLYSYDPDDKSFKVDGKSGRIYLDASTVIFSIKYDTKLHPTDDSEVVALSNLAEDDNLKGADIYNVDADDDVVGCIVLRGDNEFFGSTDNATFVTKVSESKNADGDDIVYIYGYKDGEAVTYTSEDLTKDDVEVGSLIIPVYTTSGELNAVKVCETGANLGTDKAALDGKLTKIDSKHNTIFVDGKEIKVKSANVYVYNDRLSRSKALVDQDIDYIDYDEDTGALTVDKESVKGKVNVSLFYVDDEVVDVVFYISK